MATVSTKLSFDGAVFHHQIGEQIFDFDMSVFDSNPALRQKALEFAVKTASRNATAGKLSTAEEVKEAIEAVMKRHNSWRNGEWAARREASGDKTYSVLIQALAELSNGRVTEDEIAEMIESQIEEKIDAAGLDKYSEDKEIKSKVRAIGREVRKQYSSKPVVAAKVKALELAKLQEQAAKAEAAAQGQTADDLFVR